MIQADSILLSESSILEVEGFSFSGNTLITALIMIK